MPRRMKTHSNNLVIVCEGTDTEYLYFSELKDYVLSHFPDRYSDIKVVPVPEEIIKEKNPKRSAQARKLNNVPQYHYYCKYESTADAYALYRAQPTRYVRETALFMQEDGYAEGWAVFDNDKHPAHEAAFRYASQDHVGIAFSSYSFEEWLLAHFERCPKAFQHSECKEGDKELRCGSIDAAADGDCHGENCIGGRLRSQGYIPDYSKNGKGVFGKYTLQHLETAMINSAWLRYRSSGASWESNPYTDVDVLVAKMLNEQKCYDWYVVGRTFNYAGSKIMVSMTDDGQIEITNIGDMTVIIRDTENAFVNSNFAAIASCERVLLEPGDSKRVAVPDNAVAFVLKSGVRHSIIDLAS